MERRAELVDENESGVMSFVCFAAASMHVICTSYEVAADSAPPAADAYYQLLHTNTTHLGLLGLVSSVSLLLRRHACCLS